eukprot:26445-Pelagomonas_calceolata.AAC.2
MPQQTGGTQFVYRNEAVKPQTMSTQYDMDRNLSHLHWIWMASASAVERWSGEGAQIEQLSKLEDAKSFPDCHMHNNPRFLPQHQQGSQCFFFPCRGIRQVFIGLIP